MANVKERMDEIEQNIMSGLKDFQQATVNRIEELYRNQGQMRVLVSDEVGLGKTLIAKGTVAKVAKIRRDEGDELVKVVYVCSNAAIAGQNLNKLRITHELKVESTNTSRLSMQHLNIFFQENDSKMLDNYIQLIPLTPDTSFRITNGSGTVSERALMYAILKRLDELNPYVRYLETGMMGNATSSWNSWAKNYYEDLVRECNTISNGKYLVYMKDAIRKEMSKVYKDGSSYMDGLIEFCERIKKNRNRYVPDNGIIGNLRLLFARISIEKLEPDLVIMDDFQRFRYLINSDSESEIGILAKKFFNSDKVRMLLLSATPYKMYSTLEEIDELQTDEHYSEFLEVMSFLNVTEESCQEFHEVWKNYSVQIKELTSGKTTVIQAKNAAEDAMYRNVCRTERISAVENADIINDSDVKNTIEVMEQDIKSYLQAQTLLDDIGESIHVPVDYIKSAPYILSFMRDYQFKRRIEKYFKEHPNEIRKANKDTLWLKRSLIAKYEKIPIGNARLERVMQHVFKKNAELLLWVPPSKPYYENQGAFKNARHFSKTLVFSSWEMVPRMLACMLSYEAERKTVGRVIKQSEKDVKYFASGEKRYPLPKLNFSVSNGKPNAMTLFTLMYPSKFLAGCYDPIYCLNAHMSLKAIEKDVKYKIKNKLEKYNIVHSGPEDKRWYYMAPLFLDGAGYVTGWMKEDMLEIEDVDDEGRKQKGFKEHVRYLRQLYYDNDCGRAIKLGKQPRDLYNVLTDMAIASPAICTYRTYIKYAKGKLPCEFPSQMAKVFINRMNTPEATAIIELTCGRKSEDAHWQNILSYCKNGNFQAMFDEYAHLISNGYDDSEDFLKDMHKNILESMDFRTTVYNIDTYNSFSLRMRGSKENTTNIRTNFAVAFTKGDGKEKDTDRKSSLRNAFNSPFRPFVLSSTSIGQEGLDFHNYCRRIVHWNLPSNPIDLEQREGRINRFKCLAIRQNISQRYGNELFDIDVWEEMFEKAKQVESTEGCSELIPFWGLKETDDMIKIERIVPMYPYSRDGHAYERLIKILSLYRLTLGQARQEELLEYLFEHCENPENMREMFINLSPFYRRRKKKQE